MSKQQFTKYHLTALTKRYGANVLDIRTKFMSEYKPVWESATHEEKLEVDTPCQWQRKINANEIMGVYVGGTRNIYISNVAPVWVWIHELAHYLHANKFNGLHGMCGQAVREDLADLVALAFYKYFGLDDKVSGEGLCYDRIREFIKFNRKYPKHKLIPEKQYYAARVIAKSIIHTYKTQVVKYTKPPVLALSIVKDPFEYETFRQIGEGCGAAIHFENSSSHEDYLNPCRNCSSRLCPSSPNTPKKTVDHMEKKVAMDWNECEGDCKNCGDYTCHHHRNNWRHVNELNSNEGGNGYDY